LIALLTLRRNRGKAGDNWRPAATVKEQAAQIQKVSAQLVFEIAGVLMRVK
jgi:hypothetical protein